MATVNMRRKVYSILKGAFSDSGLGEFVRDLIGQRGMTVAFDDLPAVPDIEPWDGMDGMVHYVHTLSYVYTCSLTRIWWFTFSFPFLACSLKRTHILTHTHTHTHTHTSQLLEEDDWDLSDFDMDDDVNKDEL